MFIKDREDRNNEPKRN